MADQKISQLTGATTPLAGTEVLPIVQSSTTKKVSVANLTAGRDVAAQSVTVNQSGMTSSASFGQFPGSTTYGQINFNGATTLGGLSGLIGGGASGTVFINAPTGGTLNLLNGGGYVLQLGATDVTLSAGNLIQGTAAKGINFTANTGAAGMTSQLLNWYEEGTWTPNQGAGLVVVGTFSSTGKYVRIGNQVTVSGTLNGSTSIATTSASFMTTNLPFSSSGYATGTAVNSGITASVGMVLSGTGIYSSGSLAASSYIFFSITYVL